MAAVLQLAQVAQDLMSSAAGARVLRMDDQGTRTNAGATDSLVEDIG